MYSEIIPWDEFIGSVKDDSGIENLDNRYDTIVRSIYRTARDIGFGGSLLLKRKEFEVTEDMAHKRFRLPSDIVRIEDVGMCQLGFCPDTYRIQGNYLFVCHPAIKKFSLMYYTLLVDENARPVITSNHYEAMIANAVRTLYKPKRFNSKGNANQYALYNMEYEDRVGEARGKDVMPTTQEEWKEIASMLNMSRREYLIYDTKSKKYCCVSDTASSGNSSDTVKVYYWQNENFEYDINGYLSFTESDLESKANQTLSTFLDGFTVPHTTVGKFIIAVRSSAASEFEVYNIFDQKITDITFEKIYNPNLRADFFVSKNIYSLGDVYFKLKNE